MTREEREEAIEQLEIARGLIEQNGKDYLDERDIPILNLAIEALQQQEEYVTKMDEVRRAYDNISKAEPFEDCVSREAVKSALCKLCGDALFSNSCPFVNGDCDDLNAINALPPVTPKSKTGYWITLKDEYGDVVEAVCSNCDKNGNHKWSLCPYCGATMVEQQESEDKK